MRNARTIAVLTLALSSSALLGAQGLADAARKADEQRKANDKPPVVYKQVDRPGLSEVPLTMASFDNYVNARVAMARLWQRNRPLYDRVRTGGAAVERLRDFAGVLESEPEVVELLKFYNLSPDGLVLTEYTLRRALARTEGGYGQLSGIEAENSAFMGKHLGRVQYQIRHYVIQEAGLHAWPEWLAY